MRKTLSVVAVMALALGACGDDDATTGGDGGNGGNGGAVDAGFGGEVTLGDEGRLQQADCEGDNVASDADGVTEDTVNVAALTIDFEALGAIGFAASDRDPAQMFSVFVDEVNEAGGVCGRTIDLQEIRFNILAGEGGQACVEATEDRANLAVNTTGYAEVLCLTDAGVPVFSGSDLTEAEMDSTGGLLLTRFPRVEDQYRATVEYAHGDGALDGTVGVWYGSIYPEQTAAVEDVVLPMLDELDVDYTAFRTDAIGPSDPEGNAVLTAAATDFASRGIDTLLAFVQNTNHTGMQTELDAQGVNPRFISMPISANTANELFADRFGTTEVGDGQEFVTFTLGATELGDDDPIAASCHEIWTRRTGEAVSPNSFDYSSITASCVQVDVLAAGLSLAGGDLTRDRFVAALRALPAYRVPPVIGEVDWTGDSSFGPSVFSVQDYDGSTNTVRTRDETFEIGG
jgi:hypothetical protein